MERKDRSPKDEDRSRTDKDRSRKNKDDTMAGEDAFWEEKIVPGNKRSHLVEKEGFRKRKSKDFSKLPKH